MFYQEQAAMMIMTSGTVSSIQDENMDFFTKKLGIAQYPAVEGGKGKNTDHLAGANVLSVSSGTKNKAMAAKLVNFLCTDETLQQALMETGGVPIRQGLKAQNPIMQELLAGVAQASYLQNYIDQTLSAELAELHKDTVQALFGGTMTSRQAAEEMQKAFDTAQ